MKWSNGNAQNLSVNKRIKANRFLTVAGSKQLPYNRVYTYIIHTASSRKYNSQVRYRGVQPKYVVLEYSVTNYVWRGRVRLSAIVVRAWQLQWTSVANVNTSTQSRNKGLQAMHVVQDMYLKRVALKSQQRLGGTVTIYVTIQLQDHHSVSYMYRVHETTTSPFLQ